jgi:hypothetical protein
MIDYFRRHLGAKIFFSYLVIIVLGVAVLVIASQFVLPSAFNRHMAGMAGNGMMGMNGNGVMSQLYIDFRADSNACGPCAQFFVQSKCCCSRAGNVKCRATNSQWAV